MSDTGQSGDARDDAREAKTRETTSGWARDREREREAGREGQRGIERNKPGRKGCGQDRGKGEWSDFGRYAP